MMQPPLPGSPEFFFMQVANFLRENAQGDVRCMVITETTSKQCWISSMVDSIPWQFGMLETANKLIGLNFERALKEHADRLAAELKDQELRAAEVKGKPQ